MAPYKFRIIIIIIIIIIIGVYTSEFGNTTSQCYRPKMP